MKMTDIGDLLDYVTVESDPSLVGQTNAKLTIQTTLKKAVPVNGYLKLSLPTEVKIRTGTLSCSITGDIILNGVSCSATTTQLVQLRVGSQLSAGFTIQINIADGFYTPSSSADTSTFGFSTFQSDGATMIDFKSTGIVLAVSPNSLTSAKMVPVTTGIVGSSTKAQVTLVLKNAIPTNALLTMTFPKWNPQASFTQLTAMIVSPITCAGVTNVDSSAICTYDTATDTLTLESAFASGRAAGASIVFNVDTVKNPLSFSPVSITVRTETADGNGAIDQSTMTYASTSPASIPQATTLTTADDTTVQEYSSFRLEFQNPVPLNSGTIVTVVFPQQFTFDSKLTAVVGFGLFGSTRSLRFTADESQRSIKITDGLETYRAAGITAKLVFQSIKNPQYVRKTDTFSVYLTDSSGYQIAQVTANVFFQPTVGTVETTLVTVAKSEVNTATTLNIQFSPKHQLTTASIITMTVPNNLIIACANFKGVTGFSSSVKCTATSTTTFVFTSLFTSTYTQKTLVMQFTSYTNPSSVQPITGITITTTENVNDGVNGIQNYTVDNLVSTASLYTVTPALFVSQAITVDSTLTYTTSTFTFNLTTTNAIPVGGFLKITLPAEVTPQSSTFKCVGIKNMATTINCALSTVNSENVITLSNAFTNAVGASQQIQFSINNLKTPPSTRTSSSFKIYSTDASQYNIDQVISLLTVTMLAGSNINSITANSDSNTVAEMTQVTISFLTPLPFRSGNNLYITFPDEVLAPTKLTLACTGADSLNTNQPCDVNGQVVTVFLSPRSSPTGENSRVTIKIRTIKNPLNTKTSGEFKLTLRESEGYAMAQSATTTGAYLIVGTPSPIKTASITALDLRQMALTTITISMVTNNMIAAGGYLMINFDFIFFKFYDKSIVSCSTNLVQNVTCNFDTSDTIYIKNIFQSDIQPNTTISFTINNCLLEIDTKMVTKSWVVTTMTPEGYMVDRASDILTLNFPCNMPCQSCLASNPNYCLSCNAISGNTILYRNKCYSQCPSGLYLDDYQQCQPCDSKCKSCRQDNPQYCLSCDINSVYPYLDGTTCIDSCPFGTFQNVKTARCEACASPCESCQGSATNCLTCDQKSPSKYFQGSQCHTQCPTGYLLPTTATDTLCQTCDPQCRSCAGTSSSCTSCNTPLLLSQYDSTCGSTCPFGRTVYNPSTNICEICDQKCTSCSTQTTFCTSCADNLFLLEKTGSCVGACSTDNKLVGVNGICTGCSSQCGTCINKPDSCLTCTSGKYFFDFTCVTTCPDGYEVEEASNQCVIQGLRCPFGYKVNSQGNGCILKAQICEGGFRLNNSKDRCIPGPGNYVPFPFIYACILLSLLSLGSWIKYKQTLIVTNIVAGISFIETIALFTLVISSYQMGVYSTFGLSLIALLFLYGSNMFFCIIFVKTVNNDGTFKHWAQVFHITQNVILVLGGLVNFKCFRIIYGRFFNRDQFTATFDDNDAFFKPFTFISVFSLVTTMLPVLVANIVGLVFIEYGYQVQMTCIELTLMELVMLGLMIYEKIKMKDLVLKPNPYYKVDPKYMDKSELNVMSGVQDSDITSYYSLKSLIPNQHKSKNKVDFQEYYERRRGLEQLISTLISKDATTKKESSTEDHITQLQEEERLRYQLRNCRSFKELRTIDEDFADADAADMQNFISEPNSPREKELLHNPKFVGSVMEFKRAVKSRDMYDNVYAEARPAHYFPMRDCKLVTVKVQTNILELLAIDDMQVNLPANKKDDAVEEEYVEENLTKEYTTNLLDKLVDHFKDAEFKKQRRRLPKNRLQQIPNFDLSDILGDFDVDEAANHVIIKGKDGKLNDREGRRVNRRGYLVDPEGNVITNRNVLIFKRDEVDSDDEIPAPFCFEKKKQSLFKIENLAQYNQKQKKRKVEDKEDDIEKEFAKIREKNASNRSSVDSLMGETPSKYNKKNKRFIPGDEDGFLSKIVQPMQAKSKMELMNRQRRNQQELDYQNTQDTIKFHTDQKRQESTIESRDNFFSALAANQGVYKDNRPQLTQSSVNQPSYDPIDFSLERINKIAKLKEVLGDHQEDKVLLKQLENYERVLKAPIQEAKGKSTLQKKNLAKVYGKVQERVQEIGEFHKPRRLINQSFLEDTQDSQRRRAKPPAAPGDSRLKNLESIYMKTRPQTNQTRRKPLKQSQAWEESPTTQKYRHLQHSMADTTGVESSDQEVTRIKRELDQMQATLNKDQRMTKVQNAKKGYSKQLMDGGWI